MTLYGLCSAGVAVVGWVFVVIVTVIGVSIYCRKKRQRNV